MYIFEKGQGLVEYALIIVLISIVVILALNYLAPTIGNVFTEIGTTLVESI
ncbi:MAG: Flp family type IVb pilin [Anaerolineales bacterium]|jgi:pilus assembly protein Flp/PilA